MSSSAVFFVDSARFEPAWQIASMAVTAAALGDQVHLVFGFDALRALMAEKWGTPESADEMRSFERAQKTNVAMPLELIQEARALGARLICCETTLSLCGFTSEQARAHLDDVMGLASIWRLTEGAKVFSR